MSVVDHHHRAGGGASTPSSDLDVIPRMDDFLLDAAPHLALLELIETFNGYFGGAVGSKHSDT